MNARLFSKMVISSASPSFFSFSITVANLRSEITHSIILPSRVTWWCPDKKDNHHLGFGRNLKILSLAYHASGLRVKGTSCMVTIMAALPLDGFPGCVMEGCGFNSYHASPVPNFFPALR